MYLGHFLVLWVLLLGDVGIVDPEGSMSSQLQRLFRSLEDKTGNAAKSVVLLSFGSSSAQRLSCLSNFIEL